MSNQGNLDSSLPDFVTQYPNVASVRLGAKIISSSDDFFADKSRLIQDTQPVFYPDKYDDHGKWMDGWESRRRRDGGHDYCVLRLGSLTTIAGICIDTAYFTGNFPPGASLEASKSTDEPKENEWVRILDPVDLKGDQKHYFEIASQQNWNWLRLNIYPDGGVARLRIYGRPKCDWEDMMRSGVEAELSGLMQGGRIVGYSDAHYGSLWTLLSPDDPINMGDGWETQRRRTDGHDWIIIALGHKGVLSRGELDTAFFKGNFPAAFSLQGAGIGGMSDQDIIHQSTSWPEMLKQSSLNADNVHSFDIHDASPITHIRLNIYPDGGVARFRLFGKAV